MRHLLLGVALAAAPALPLVVRSSYVIHVAVLCAIYVILTLSLNLITGFCGQFSLGHGCLYGFCAYTAALLAVRLGSPFLLNLAAAAVVAGLVGFLIGLPTLRLGGIYPIGWRGPGMPTLYRPKGCDRCDKGIIEGDFRADRIVRFQCNLGQS